MTVEATRTLDPVTLEVIRNALPAISDEMSYDLQRTSYNMMIYEVRDYCTALLDTRGRLMSQNIGGVSHFVADLGVVIKDGIAQHGLDGFAPGDVLVHNHQAVAGQHLNNVVVYTPVFYEGGLVAFAVVRAHWVDVGGLSTGFGAGNQAFDPWAEGLQFDQVKLYERGEPDRKLLKFIRTNIRYPDAAMGDLRSQLAACRLGDRRYTELLRRYGADIMPRAIETLYAETEQKCRAVVAQIPDGVYEAACQITGGGTGAPYDIHAKVTIRGSDMEIDLSGCSPQREGGMNARTYAGAYIAYKALTAPLEPVNEGSFAAVNVIIPEGNMLMAIYPAPMANWSGMLPSVVETIWKALAPAIPDRIPASHSRALGPVLVFFGYDPQRKRRFVVQSIEGGGWGGRPTEDGEDVSVSVCQGDVRNAPIENIELKNPVLVEERSLRQDSAGPGKFRGGLGIQTRARALVEGRWAAGAGGPEGNYGAPPWGLWGGRDGAPPQQLMQFPDAPEPQDPPAARTLTPANTTLILRSAGGGGWGDPLEREPARVLRDVIEGYVSVGAARDDYGVVLTADAHAVDAAATDARRAALRQARNGAADGSAGSHQ
jgi:N-methylhydantoinase B